MGVPYYNYLQYIIPPNPILNLKAPVIGRSPCLPSGVQQQLAALGALTLAPDQQRSATPKTGQRMVGVMWLQDLVQAVAQPTLGSGLGPICSEMHSGRKYGQDAPAVDEAYL